MDISTASRLSHLETKLVNAKLKASNARADLKKAERMSERADDFVAELRYEIDIERLRLWGNQPDLKALLESDGSMALYQAGQGLAEAYGLGWGMQWSDTKQTVLHICLNRGEAGSVERAKIAVLYFAPHIKAKNGLKRFGVRHREMADFAVELRYSEKSGATKVVCLHFADESDVKSFTTLESALRHVEEHHWIEDIIEMEAASDKLTVDA